MRELFHVPQHLIDARQARGIPCWYSRMNSFDSIVVGKRWSSTLTFDDHLEIHHRSPSLLDSRYYCYHCHCCTQCLLTVKECNGNIIDKKNVFEKLEKASKHSLEVTQNT